MQPRQISKVDILAEQKCIQVLSTKGIDGMTYNVLLQATYGVRLAASKCRPKYRTGAYSVWQGATKNPFVLRPDSSLIFPLCVEDGDGISKHRLTHSPTRYCSVLVTHVGMHWLVAVARSLACHPH